MDTTITKMKSMEKEDYDKETDSYYVKYPNKK